MQAVSGMPMSLQCHFHLPSRFVLRVMLSVVTISPHSQPLHSFFLCLTRTIPSNALHGLMLCLKTTNQREYLPLDFTNVFFWLCIGLGVLWLKCIHKAHWWVPFWRYQSNFTLPCHTWGSPSSDFLWDQFSLELQTRIKAKSMLPFLVTMTDERSPNHLVPIPTAIQTESFWSWFGHAGNRWCDLHMGLLGTTRHRKTAKVIWARCCL